MRYITIPKPVLLEMCLNKHGEPLLYPLRDFLREYVWPQRAMRERPDVALSLAEKLDTIEERTVGLSDEDHEFLLQCARDADYQPVLALPFLKFQFAIANASREAPKE